MKLLKRFKYTYNETVVKVRAKDRTDADIAFYKVMRQLNKPEFKWQNVEVEEIEK